MDENMNQQNGQIVNQQPDNGGKGLSIASLVLGIVSVIFSCCLWYIGLPCGIIGLVLGILSMKKKAPGKGMAIAGIILSAVALVLGIITIFCLIFAASVPWDSILSEMQSMQ